MAVTVLLDCYLLLAGTSYQSQLVKAQFDATVVNLDTTTMGAAAGWTTVTGGLKSGKASFDFNNDYTATTGLDAVLWGAFGTVITFELRPTSGARAPGNPAYTGSVLIDTLQPIAGKVGDLAVQSISWPCSAQVLRQTS